MQKLEHTNLKIRLIEPRDNTQLAELIKTVLASYGCTGPGYASSDAELEDMYTAYSQDDTRYWIIEDEKNQKVLGGCGFARLNGTSVEEGVCELRKLYFYPKLRGLGYGKKLMNLVLSEAVKAGFKEIYLETVPQLVEAIGLYKKFGFSDLPCHMGNTGHQERCNVYMSKSLLEYVSEETTSR